MKTSVQSLMEKTGVKFGTSGVRALVAELSDLICYSYTKGFIQFLENEGELAKSGEEIAIAGDLRKSTDRIMEAVRRAVVDSGYSPINCGKIPTPAVSLFGFSKKIPSIMITGSHIPEDRNGIKFVKSEGEVLKSDEPKITKQEIEIADNLFGNDGMFLKQEKSGEMISAEAEKMYIDRYLRFFDSGALKNLSLGVYQHSAVGRDLVAGILEKLGAKVKTFGRSENFVAVDSEALQPDTLAYVRKSAKKLKTDAIVSTDGDSDRPIIWDENGEWVENDIADILCAKFLGADSICTTASTTTAAEKCGWFSEIRRVKIGSPFVIAEMNEARLNDKVGQAKKSGAKNVIGYENNGGFLIGNDIALGGKTLKALPTRDALIVILSVLSEAKKRGEKISEMAKRLPAVFMFSGHIQNFPAEKSKMILQKYFGGENESENLANAEKLFGGLSGEPESIGRIDGVRIFFKKGEIIHIRPSSNAPELRAYIEASSRDRAMELCEKALEILKGL